MDSFNVKESLLFTYVISYYNNLVSITNWLLLDSFISGETYSLTSDLNWSQIKFEMHAENTSFNKKNFWSAHFISYPRTFLLETLN